MPTASLPAPALTCSSDVDPLANEDTVHGEWLSTLAHELSLAVSYFPVVYSLTDAGAPSTQPHIHALPDSSISSDLTGDTFAFLLAPIKL